MPEESDPTHPPSSVPPTSSSSTKQSPPPIDTTSPRTSIVRPESSIIATTPLAMESAMRFEEEARKSLHLASTSNPPVDGTQESTFASEDNAITSSLGLPDSSTSEEDPSPGIVITLLILSGARSTFTLNPGYIKRHNVPHEDAMMMTVYNLKECIWRDWKEEELMTKQPASPHLIRLILLGRLLEDKSLLKDCRLQLESPNVVHLSLRPADIAEDEVTTKSGKFTGFNGNNGRTGERPSPGCRCVIL
ncbi:hypothetical protein TWF106_002849 [Orbilia oligospora]|uniref:UBL3-like ubiquitin domain-containing protein n=2 Tax=Orbilia oligospora TaxID=2813651 RepID=A0A6G1M3W1_ORBOL|nr:hypothetical protein TWF788_006981 [Orbilia oligospora]KAF3201310.1 hypothetical protein TWF106_002849 [Orbilia oligospora]KAF3218005.1 hypothetical protein TWF679_001418 [Orbilia oligospora]KAF3244225.1 hypothetical protein TWF192_007786 [Orbilia oligospora]